MSEDKPKAVVVELFYDRQDKQIGGKGEIFHIVTLDREPKLVGIYQDYEEAEQRSRGLYELVKPSDVGPWIWGETDEAQSVVTESDESLYYDEQTGISAVETVVWFNGTRAPLDARHPRNRFWVYRSTSPSPLMMCSTASSAVLNAKKFAKMALAERERLNKDPAISKKAEPGS